MRSFDVPLDALLRPEWRAILAIGAQPGDVITEDTDGTICIVRFPGSAAEVLARRALRGIEAARTQRRRRRNRSGPLQLVRN